MRALGRLLEEVLELLQFGGGRYQALISEDVEVLVDRVRWVLQAFTDGVDGGAEMAWCEV